MSVVTTMTGASPPQDDLSSILSVMSNPEAYAKKLKEISKKLEEINAAKAVNQSLIEAIGPASEIPALREAAKVAKAEAEAALEAARLEAAEIVKAAKASANDLVSKATAEANDLLDKAKQASAEATHVKTEALNIKQNLRDAETLAKKRAADAEAAATASKVATAAAEEARASYISARAGLRKQAELLLNALSTESK